MKGAAATEHDLAPQRYRAAWIWVAGAGLLALGLVLYFVDREVGAEASFELTNERIHIERVTAIRRAARSTYVLLLERWLRPLPERGERERTIEGDIETIRHATDSFAQLPPVEEKERAVVRSLVVDVEVWANRVQQALIAADGPTATGELRAYIDAIDRDTDAILAIDSSAGTSTDARVADLRRQQSAIQTALVASALGVLGLAFIWFRGKAAADLRFAQSERARTENERAAELRSQFFANMSHELRTPLVAIRGFTTVITDTAGVEGNVHKTARQIDREAAELLGHIDNVLDAANLARGQIDVHADDVDVDQVVRRCVQRCAPLAVGKSVELSVEVGPGVPRLRTDAVKLQHVLMNLVANAIKFTTKGRVAVRASVDSSPSEGVTFEVEDTGVGIPDEALDRIWNPFEQASPEVSRRFGGTGLGLSIVRGLVERLGGEVGVRSTLGKGTTFTVKLPQMREELP
jgi:signal transduction histidine kinase